MKRKYLTVISALLSVLLSCCDSGSVRPYASGRMLDVYGDIEYDDEMLDDYYENWYHEDEEDDDENIQTQYEGHRRSSDRIVWISTSPNAKAYHIYEDCEALVQTVHEIMWIDISDADSMGRHLCRYCEERMECEMDGEEYIHEW